MIGLVTAPEATLRRVVFKVKTVKSDTGTVVHGSASDAWQTMVATPINAMVGRAKGGKCYGSKACQYFSNS
jgi:hypothetical protein